MQFIRRFKSHCLSWDWRSRLFVFRTLYAISKGIDDSLAHCQEPGAGAKIITLYVIVGRLIMQVARLCSETDHGCSLGSPPLRAHVGSMIGPRIGEGICSGNGYYDRGRSIVTYDLLSFSRTHHHQSRLTSGPEILSESQPDSWPFSSSCGRYRGVRLHLLPIRCIWVPTDELTTFSCHRHGCSSFFLYLCSLRASTWAWTTQHERLHWRCEFQILHGLSSDIKEPTWSWSLVFALRVL